MTAWIRFSLNRDAIIALSSSLISMRASPTFNAKKIPFFESSFQVHFTLSSHSPYRLETRPISSLADHFWGVNPCKFLFFHSTSARQRSFLKYFSRDEFDVLQHLVRRRTDREWFTFIFHPHLSLLSYLVCWIAKIFHRWMSRGNPQQDSLATRETESNREARFGTGN